MKLWKLIPRAIREQLVRRELKKLLNKLGLPKAIMENIMSGWKTWAGGVALIGSGLALIGKSVSSGEFNFDEIMKGVSLIGAGLGAIGLGHKVDKNTAAVEDAAATTQTVKIVS